MGTLAGSGLIWNNIIRFVQKHSMSRPPLLLPHHFMWKRVEDSAKLQELLEGWKSLETSSESVITTFPHYHDSFGVNLVQSNHYTSLDFLTSPNKKNIISAWKRNGTGFKFRRVIISWLDKKKKYYISFRRVTLFFNSRTEPHCH